MLNFSKLHFHLFIKLFPKKNIINSNSVALLFHSNSLNNAKTFVDKENLFAHSFFEINPNYKLFKEPEKLTLNIKKIEELQLYDIHSNSSTSEIFRTYKNLIHYCHQTDTCISNDIFDKFIDIFVIKCHDFSDSDLIECLKILIFLPPTPNAKFKNYVELWSSLDDALSKRLDKWDIDQILMVCDCWYTLNLSRLCEFVIKALQKIGRKPKRLEKNQIVHSLFFHNCIRKAVPEMIYYEVAFYELVNEMNINEIGIMAMGFFKTQTMLRNQKLVHEIFKRVIENLDTIEDITLVNCLKILRYSSIIAHSSLIDELSEKICPQIHRLSLLSCLHVALLGTKIQQCHEKSLELIVNRFNQSIESVRLKDMERICHVLALLDYHSEQSDKLCANILQLLESKIDEINQYPRCFPSLIHYLVLRGFHRDYYISAALDQKFIRHTYGSNMKLGRELFCLDAFARINLKDVYDGNLLSPNQRKTMGRILTNYIPEKNSKYRLSSTDRWLLEIKESCDNLFKNQTHFKHILPHFERPDILLCYDKKKKEFIKLSSTCPNDYEGVILTKNLITNASDVKPIAVVIAGWNNIVRGTKKPTGLLKMKLNQMEILGYSILMIPWYEWQELENTSDKLKFIQRKLLPILS